MATTLDELRTPHPQQAQIDAESAKMLRPRECDFCHAPTFDPYHIGPWIICDECIVVLRRVLTRAIREETTGG